MAGKPTRSHPIAAGLERGDRAALDHLLPLVAAELHRIAQNYMRRERAGHTLQTTALVHEAYLRLIDADHVRLEEPGPLLRGSGADDAPHTGRPRAANVDRRERGGAAHRSIDEGDRGRQEKRGDRCSRSTRRSRRSRQFDPRKAG